MLREFTPEAGFRGLRILNCRCRTGCAMHNGCTAFFNGHNNYPCRILLLFRGNHLFDFFDDSRSVFNCVLQSDFITSRDSKRSLSSGVTATEWMMMVASAISCASGDSGYRPRLGFNFHFITGFYRRFFQRLSGHKSVSQAHWQAHKAISFLLIVNSSFSDS